MVTIKPEHTQQGTALEGPGLSWYTFGAVRSLDFVPALMLKQISLVCPHAQDRVAVTKGCLQKYRAYRSLL